MPFLTVKLNPGVNVEATPTLNSAGISLSNLIRFRDGLTEKIGGWERFYNFTVGGVVRALHAWQALNADTYLAAGTTTALVVISDGALTNITPQTKTTNPALNFSVTNASNVVTITDASISNVTTYDSVYFGAPVSIGGLILSGLYPIDSVAGVTSYRILAASNATSTTTSAAVPSFGTTSGSPTVSVTLNGHGLAAGDEINLPVSTTVGGIIIQGTYPVTSVTSANIFVITADTVASSTTSGSMNAGNANFVYYITIGPSSGFSGYSIGTYSSGGYSTGTALTVQTGTPITSADWSLDNWGEILLANPEGGAIYYWQPNTGFVNANLVPDGPQFCNGMFVSMQAQILVTYGASQALNIGVDSDPLLLKWSAQGDFLDWAVSTTSQAGFYRIPTGSEIRGGMAAAHQDLIWTDLDLWSMNYLGFPLVYGLEKIGSNCGLIAKHGNTRQGGNVYWMGLSNFFVMGGSGVQPIPCTVWDKVFQNLNTGSDVNGRPYVRNVRAWSNTPFNEIWWFYPSAASVNGENDSYVKLNTLYGAWDYGSLGRTAAIDQSVLGMPIAADPTGLIFQHETGYNGDGQALSPFMESGWFTLTEGEDFAFVDWLLPDMKWQTSDASSTPATVQITLYSADYPGGTVRTYGPYSVQQATKFVNTRLRGRLAKLRVGSGDTGSFWRMGGLRYRIAQDGRR